MAMMDTMDRANVGLIAAGIGFFAALSIFPALAVVVMVWSLVADPVEVNRLLDLGAEVMPPDIHRMIAGQVRGLIAAGETTLGWATLLTLGFAVWSARAGVASLIRGLNAVYRTDHRQSIMRRYLAALGLTVALCGVALVAIAVVVVAPIVLAFLPLGPAAAWTAEAVRWTIGFAVVFAALGLCYRFGPNRRGARPAWITWGALVATLLWLAMSAAFSWYLSNFANYNEVYGSLGAAVALLMWFYLSAFVVLLGGAINAELDPRVPPRPATPAV